LKTLFKKLKKPLRNVFRNKRRTGFSLAIIALGVAILLATLAFTDEAITSTKRSLAGDSGAVQVAAPELFEDRAEGFDYLIGTEEREAIYSLIEKKEGVVGATSRLEFGGLISNGNNEATVVHRGIVPENCVQDYSCVLAKGEPLNPSNQNGLVLGEALSEKIDTEIGDSLNFSFNDADGNYRTVNGEVIGLANFSSRQLEEQLAITTLSFAQSSLGTKGVGRIIISLEDVDRSGDFASRLEAQLNERGYDLETRTWQELNPLYDSLSTFWNAFSAFTYIAVFALVFFSTLEVLTMSFLERTREVGTIKAVGTTRWGVFRDFMIEGGLIGLVGGLMGIGLGVLIGFGVNFIGFTWKPPGATIPEPLTIRLTFTTIALPLVAAVFSTLLGSVFPAWKNSRVDITKALRGK
jgi:putative ABC transport system permease protein